MEQSKNNEDPNYKFWRMSEKELYNYFQTDERGYSDSKVEELKKIHPLNELEEEEKESILEKIYEQFEDPLVRILLGAAIISFIIALTGDSNEGITAYIEPFVILLILIANATIGVWQDINAGKAIDALKKLQASKCIVKRGGKEISLDSKYLLPGDIVFLSEGEKSPADIRIIEVMTSNFEVSEANFTGEAKSAYKTSDPIFVDEKPVLRDLRNIVFSTSGVTTGSAVGMVVLTAMNTEIGKIKKMIDETKETKEKSPLEKKLEEFGDYLTYIIGAICVVVWVINYKNFFDEVHGTFFNGMIYYFKISVALAVAAIPEGLPAVITTCFALGSRRMAANNAIVRKLDAIETLGCTTVICSDKTGTLTTNNMSVTKFMILENDSSNVTPVFKEISGTSFNPIGEIKDFDKSYYQNSLNLQTALRTCSICNLSKIKIENDGQYAIVGSPTEGALIVFAEKLRIYDSNFTTGNSQNDPMAYNYFLRKEYKILYTLEFDRDRKAMSVLALDIKNNKPVLFTKGACEIIINQCANYYTRNGKLASLNDQSKNIINDQVNDQFLNKSLRALALSIKEDLPSLKDVDYNDKNSLKAFFKDRERIREIEKDLTFLGVVGMLDPPRIEVKSAIETCEGAGIRVIMITGDNKNTAESIGVDIGIVETESNLKTCSYTTSEFMKLPKKEQLQALKNNNNMIFSRSEPRHKMELVRLLKELGHIVAMTGDGVNDAPALAEAHIGVAMGLSGTDVAKEASHIILADDNFATIVKAIEEGRSIYMNMKAFIRYLISSNIGEVVSIFITSMFGLPEALNSIQLLWVNNIY